MAPGSAASWPCCAPPVGWPRPPRVEPCRTSARPESRRGEVAVIGDTLRMARRFARGSGARLALTVAALACGVALVCAIDLVNRAVLAAFVEVVDTMAGRAALQVTAIGVGQFSEEVAATVAAVPGVELAVPVVDATAF